MREPQVVRKSRVHRMSLCAIGIPVSGPASPLARCSSALRAMARLPSLSSSVEMKALSSALSLAVRSKQARVSSTEEIFLAASAADSSVTVELSRLLNDFGDEVQTCFHGRRDRLVGLAPIGLGDVVRAQPLDQVQSVRHGLDARGIDRLDLADQLEDPVQAAAHFRSLPRLQGDAGEAREAPDVVVGERHSRSMARRGRGRRERRFSLRFRRYVGVLYRPTADLLPRTKTQEKASACPCSDSFAATSRTISRSTSGLPTR